MTKLRFFSLLTCMALCGFFWYQSAQTPTFTGNLLRNGSFEDVPKHSTVPEQWLDFELTFKSKSEVPYLVLEAYYDEALNEAYNGNILLDGLELIEL